MGQDTLFSTRPVMHDVQDDLVVSQWKKNHSDLVTMICSFLYSLISHVSQEISYL